MLAHEHDELHTETAAKRMFNMRKNPPGEACACLVFMQIIIVWDVPRVRLFAVVP